ncbi:hypothetical protein AB7X21_16265 [Providencia rettgeri]
MKVIKQIIFGLSLMATQISSSQAVTITIGKGSGVLWEGLPFNVSMSGPIGDPNYAGNELIPSNTTFLSISNDEHISMSSRYVINIAGYQAFPITKNNSVGLIPRASGSVRYTRYNGNSETLTGTIGLPATEGRTTAGENVFAPYGRVWALPPSMTENSHFFQASSTRDVTASGTWVLVANGNQQNEEITLLPMYFGSFAPRGDYDLVENILPSNITLRISSLECTVNTPTTINFNSVARNTQNSAQLALLSMPLNTSCGQPTDKISANVNLQFRALSGLYGSAASRLSLTQGGGYITGEINNNVTGSGACNATTGLAFDNRVVKLGRIEATESSKTFNNQVTWRLCSGGSNLPTGKVDAAAEMLVTFN